MVASSKANDSAAVGSGSAAASTRAEELKHYDSNNKEFWLHPPDDWFMGDETREQKGTAPANTMGPPTGMTDEEIAAALKNIKLAPGF